jgi:hypothetical protein
LEDESLDIEDLLRKGGDTGERLVDVNLREVEMQQQDSGWSMDDEDTVDIEEEIRRCARMSSIHRFMGHPSLRSLERQAAEALEEMHRRRARKDEIQREKVVCASPYAPPITLTAPTPPRRCLAVAEEDSEDEWTLTTEMKDFWKERMERKKREKEENDRKEVSSSFRLFNISS